MNIMQDYLLKDEERFMSLLSKATNREGIMKEIRSEMDRILYAFNEQDLSERIRKSAAALTSVAKTAVEFMDVNGESKIYVRREYGETNRKGKRSWLFTLVLILSLIVLIAICGYIYIYLIRSDDTWYSWYLLAGVILSALLAFCTGVFSQRKKTAQKNDLYAETSYDTK